MSLILLFIVLLILLYSILNQNVGMFACFSILFFSVAVSLFHVISPALFSLNAAFHVGAFLILLIWQFNYYSLETILRFILNPVIMSILFLAVVIYVYNDFSPYYHTYKSIIDSSQFGFYSRILLPLMIIPMLVPDEYSRRRMMGCIPIWGVIYAIVFFSSFDISSNVISDRTVLEKSADGITGSISLSRIFAVAAVTTFVKFITMDESETILKLAYKGMSMFFLVLVLIAGQRGTLIGLGIALIFLLLRKEWRNHSANVVFVIISLLTLLSFVNLKGLQIFQRFSEFQHIENFKRYYDYINTWKIFQNNDFILGLGSLGYHFKTGRPYPHNIILEHISDYGLIGLICILILLYFCTKYAINLIRQSNNWADISIACSWIVLCFSAMISSSLLNHYLFYTFTGLLVLAHIGLKQYQRKCSNTILRA